MTGLEAVLLYLLVGAVVAALWQAGLVLEHGNLVRDEVLGTWAAGLLWPLMLLIVPVELFIRHITNRPEVRR